MLIIQIEALESGQHPIQSQSGRKTCWLPGYIEVPGHLERKVWACLGWCDLTIEGGKLTGITPGAIPEPEPAPEPEPTAQEDNDVMLIDHEYRLTLVELGVTSDAV